MKLYHPNFPGVTIERTPRQAEVLAPAGWSPDPPDHDPPPDPEPQDDES